MDWDAGLLHVDRAFKTVEGGPVLGLPKGPNGRKSRVVVLSSVALEVLQRHQVFQTERSDFIGRDWDPDGWILSYNAGATPDQTDDLHRLRDTTRKAPRPAR